MFCVFHEKNLNFEKSFYFFKKKKKKKKKKVTLTDYEEIVLYNNATEEKILCI